MNKINWINGQAGGTPLSAENLNQMQDNIEDAINNLDKTSSTLINWTNFTESGAIEYTLNDNVTNYRYIHIMCSPINADNSGNVVCQTTILSVLFKNLYKDKGLSLFNDIGDTEHNIRIRYVTDNKINVWKSSQLSTMYVKIIGLN